MIWLGHEVAGRDRQLQILELRPERQVAHRYFWRLRKPMSGPTVRTRREAEHPVDALGLVPAQRLVEVDVDAGSTECSGRVLAARGAALDDRDPYRPRAGVAR